MKQFFYSLLFWVLFISCQQQVSPEAISKINGYWEIQKVELPDGKEKEYKINETVDYFEWNGNKGFRKKVKPQLDGTFLTNNESEAKLFLNDCFHTPLARHYSAAFIPIEIRTHFEYIERFQLMRLSLDFLRKVEAFLILFCPGI